MALVVKDRVKETTTTTGTGTITLAGAVSGFQSFSSVGNGNTTYYAIVGTNEWEVGIGTYTSSGTTLSRTTILASSNSGSLVNFSAGTKDVFVTYPSGKAAYFDASGYLGVGTSSPQAALHVSGDTISQGKNYFSIGTPATKTTSVTMTGAEIVAGIVISNGSALTQTFPTGTNLQAALPTGVATLTDIGFNFSLINTGSNAATIATNTGITLTPGAGGALSVAALSSAAFYVRRTAANTFTIYRV